VQCSMFDRLGQARLIRSFISLENHTSQYSRLDSAMREVMVSAPSAPFFFSVDVESRERLASSASAGLFVALIKYCAVDGYLLSKSTRNLTHLETRLMMN
jgi:hypothetical protein